jgi:hypothetical protein
VQCTLPAGTGTQQSVVVLSAGFVSAVSADVTLSYALPNIARLECADCVQSTNVSLSNCKPAASTVLTLIGTAFGASGASVFVGTAKCAHVDHDPFSPHGLVLPVQLLQANGQLSLSSASVSYPQCAEGTYAASAAVCSPCVVGRYTAAPAQTVCSLCDVGRFANTSSSRVCTVCPRGRFQAATGRSVCDVCLPGRFARTTQSVSCDLAAPGFYASSNSSSDQVACVSGRYSSLGATVCLDCPINTIAAASGSASCTKCSSTEVSNGQGAKSCTKCPAASHAQDGACVCDDGTFFIVLLHRFLNLCHCLVAAEFYAAPSHDSLVCLRCPPGAVTCVNGRVINPADSWLVVLRRGFID